MTEREEHILMLRIQRAIEPVVEAVSIADDPDMRNLAVNKLVKVRDVYKRIRLSVETWEDNVGPRD